MTTGADAFAPYRGFAQIAYVTSDFDRAIMQFGERYGVPNWMPMPDMEIQTAPGRTCRANIGLAYVGPVQLEVIQPLGGDDLVYRAPLPANGFAVRFHHIAQTLATEAELDAAEAQAQQAQMPIAIRGAFPGGLARYFYTDHRDTLGHYVEHIWYAPEALELFNHIPRN